MIVPGSANSLLLAQGASTGYNLTKSLRFRQSASAYLSRTPSVTGNRQKYTFSGWIKRGALSAGTRQEIIAAGQDSNNNTLLAWNSDDTIRFFNQTAGSVSMNKITTAVYRDPSAWYHIVFAVDTTQATAANRNRLYINGVEVTSFSTNTDATQNENQFFNYSTSTYNAIGRYAPSSLEYIDGYMTEINFIDGQQLTPSSFGENNATTGVWQPKAYTGTYGTNGFYLPFTDVATTSGSNAGLGKDFSGNGNYWNTNNISVTSGVTYDSMTDVPTLTSATTANYAVLNPLQVTGASIGTIQNANLNWTGPANASYAKVYSTMAMTGSGKFYWEVTPASGSNLEIGIILASDQTTYYPGYSPNGYVYYQATGQKVNNNTFTSYGATYTTGDVIGVAFDAGAGTLTFYKNNVSQGTAFTGLSGTFTPTLGNEASSASVVANINFGQQPFVYTPPTGYVALNTYNLPTSTIVKGNTVMDATTYNGTGATNNVTNAGSFKPDFVWIKSRSNALNSGLMDSVRGPTKLLISNATNAEQTLTDELTSFNSNGFSLGASTSGYTNYSGYTYVGWQWQAGQGTTSSNTNGTITSTVSVNPTAGFSVVKYTIGASGGGTVGHGLGVAPQFIINKVYSRTEDWRCYNVNIGAANSIRLNTTAAAAADSVWGSTTPTSSVFTIGTGFFSNGDNCIAYCWTPIDGFSKFGTYTGNASADGPFIYTGFRPKYVMIKRSDAVEYWYTLDSARNVYNPENYNLSANSSDAEGTNTFFDFLSNGFKLRTGSAFANASGGTFLYMAFAENPFKNALAR